MILYLCSYHLKRVYSSRRDLLYHKTLMEQSVLMKQSKDHPL